MTTDPTDIVNVDFWADRIAALIKLAEHNGMTVGITGGELAVSRQVSDVFIARTEVQWRTDPAVEPATPPSADQPALRDRIVAAIKASPFEELRTVDHAANGPLQITVKVDDLADVLLRRMADEERDEREAQAHLDQLADDLAAAIASCPGRELSPNPCRCPCYGCKHHCGAHDPSRMAVEAQQQTGPACPDPIECGHEAALGQARETNRRLNLRAQGMESELATYRRAVSQWEISKRGTYVPLRTIAAIAKAAGRNIETPQWLLHYQRVEQAEAAIGRVRDAVAFAERVVATSGPGPASAVQAVIDRLRAALDPHQPAVVAAVAGEEPARPPLTEWHIDSRWNDGAWKPWTPAYPEQGDARERFDLMTSTGLGRWPLRLVRATTTYAVEAEHQASPPPAAESLRLPDHTVNEEG